MNRSEKIWDEYEAFCGKMAKKYNKVHMCMTGDISRKYMQGMTIWWSDKKQLKGE